MVLLNSKNILILGMITFLAVGFWGLYFMSVDVNGKMGNCPFVDNSSSFWPMGILEHISQWQQFFTIIRGKRLLVSLLSLLVFFAIVAFAVPIKLREKLKRLQSRQHLYWHKPEIKLFDYLVLAFSKGILNPKIYA